MHPRLKEIKIQGYRPFRDFSAQLGPLEVIVGANGSGKSSLFEFLNFLRDSLHRDIPPEIVPDSIGQRIFHSPGPERFSWEIEINFYQNRSIKYQAELMGPVGNPRVILERAQTVSAEGQKPLLLIEVKERSGIIQDIAPEGLRTQSVALDRSNQLALSVANDSLLTTPYKLRDYIRAWQFYDSFKIDHDEIRRPAFIEQKPVLLENAKNLSSILHYLMTEHNSVFDELQQVLRSAVPGFMELRVKAYGAPGQIMAFWREEGIENDLTLADLSDGILQLLCCAVLCLQPNLPPLICIDEPDQGLHPRILPILAGLFEKASDRTQILLATHSSYFLKQFDISRIAVMRKENGEARFRKPKDSRVLIDILEDFGPEEIESLHASDELEYFA